jgi:hypothetical protein
LKVFCSLSWCIFLHWSCRDITRECVSTYTITTVSLDKRVSTIFHTHTHTHLLRSAYNSNSFTLQRNYLRAVPHCSCYVLASWSQCCVSCCTAFQRREGEASCVYNTLTFIFYFEILYS